QPCDGQGRAIVLHLEVVATADPEIVAEVDAIGFRRMRNWPFAKQLLSLVFKALSHLDEPAPKNAGTAFSGSPQLRSLGEELCDERYRSVGHGDDAVPLLRQRALDVTVMPVHPFDGVGEDLLAIARPFHLAGEGRTSRFCFAADLPPLLSGQRALLVAKR